jgi:hypothetical protein
MLTKVIYLKFSNLIKIHTLARGLLLSGLVTSVGCIVPVSLHNEEQEPNARPSLVSELCDPQLEMPLVPSPTGQVSLQLVAEDSNLDDTLTARIFNVVGGDPPLVFLPPLEVVMTPSDFRRSGDMP